MTEKRKPRRRVLKFPRLQPARTSRNVPALPSNHVPVLSPELANNAARAIRLLHMLAERRPVVAAVLLSGLVRQLERAAADCGHCGQEKV